MEYSIAVNWFYMWHPLVAFVCLFVCIFFETLSLNLECDLNTRHVPVFVMSPDSFFFVKHLLCDECSCHEFLKMTRSPRSTEIDSMLDRIFFFF